MGLEGSGAQEGQEAHPQTMAENWKLRPETWSTCIQFPGDQRTSGQENCFSALNLPLRTLSLGKLQTGCDALFSLGFVLLVLFCFFVCFVFCTQPGIRRGWPGRCTSKTMPGPGCPIQWDVVQDCVSEHRVGNPRGQAALWEDMAQFTEAMGFSLLAGCEAWECAGRSCAGWVFFRMISPLCRKMLPWISPEKLFVSAAVPNLVKLIKSLT